MSNAIDIMCVGGPANGRMVCMQKNMLTTYIDFPVVGGVVTYTRHKWEHPITGKLFHIATRDGDDVTDDDIVFEVTMGNFTPAWDLNDAT